MDLIKLNAWLSKTEQERYDICKGESNGNCKNCLWQVECQTEMACIVINRQLNKQIQRGELKQ